MITLRDLYNVLSAVVPLYVAMILAYASVKWWKIFTPDQCSGINRFVALFAVPLLSFHYIASNDPFSMNFRFLAADSLAKVLVLTVLLLWVRFSKRGSLDWAITLFSLGTLPNTLVMGIPLLRAMYGQFSGDLMVQIVVFQCIIWYTLLLFLFEYRAARNLIAEAFPETAPSIASFKVAADVVSLDGRQGLQTEADVRPDGKIHVTVRKSTSSRCSVVSSRRSQGLASMPSVTPRPSNMTGAEIYSLPSSRNPTPRGSSFNHTDFYSMLAGATSGNRPLSPRHSDAYSLHRISNFDDDNPTYFPHLYPSSGNYLYSSRNPDLINHPAAAAAAAAGGHGFLGNSGMNPIFVNNPGGSTGFVGNSGLNTGGGVIMNPFVGNAGAGAAGMENSGMNTLASNSGTATGAAPGYGGLMGNSTLNHASMKHLAATKKASDPKISSPKLHDDPKKLHMFLWSSSASPMSDVGMHAFAGRPDFPAIDGSTQNSKEVRMLVMPTTENAAINGGLSEPREQFDDYVHEDFSFGNRAISHDDGSLPHDINGPSLSKLGSSSTAELTPKLHQLRKHTAMPPTKVMTKLILVMVWRKLIRNPNTYSSVLGVIWSLVSARWGIIMPVIVSKSISILSDAGLGMAMFSLGLFMALQPKIIACGNSVAAFGMAVRFLTGPAVMAASSIAIGIRGVLLHVAIVQAALPQGIVPFVFAKEYNVHPDILSTGVIFGMLIALPITVFYYFLLGL